MKSIVVKLLIALCLVKWCVFAQPAIYDQFCVVPATQNIGTFSYSSGPATYSPPNTTITIIQSPGARAYFCQTPTGTSAGLTSITMQLNNRFGSRFSNHHQGQLVMQMMCQYLYNLYFTKWSSLNTSTLGTKSIFSMSHSTSGLLVSITCNYLLASTVFSFFNTVLTDIYSATISDVDFDSLCTSMTSTLASSITSAKAANGGLFTNQHLGWGQSIQPKWDCKHAYAQNGVGDLFCVPIGSFDAYSKQQFTAMSGASEARTRAKMCLALFKQERDLTFFIASSEPSVLTQIPASLKTVSDQFTLNQVLAFNKIYYGFASPKGNLLYFINTPSADSSTGGTIALGPVSSADSLIAAELGVLLIQKQAVTNGAYEGYLGATILPMAGQVTIKVATHENTAGTNSFDNLLSNIQNRYVSGANTADASNSTYMASINNVLNKLIPKPSHAVTVDEGLYDTVLSSDNDGYINWMCLFHGGFKSFADLTLIQSGTQSDKTAAVLRAITVLYNSAIKSIATEYNYMNS